MIEPGTRPLPAWYDDAKLGIFVHWTAAAIPAFAPITSGCRVTLPGRPADAPALTLRISNQGL